MKHSENSHASVLSVLTARKIVSISCSKNNQVIEFRNNGKTNKDCTYSLISELGWKSTNLGFTAHLEVFRWDSPEECFGDTHQNIEWMNENNPSTLW